MREARGEKATAKNFRLRADQIEPLATGRGRCFATDAITVDGQRVGFMYREPPDERGDSGWRFSSGHETREYVDDPVNLRIYDVNTIANYDPGIVPLLDAPVGSAFERGGASGEFVEVEFNSAAEEQTGTPGLSAARTVPTPGP
jgi:hypothetical protein